MPFAAVNGIDIHYRLAGDGEQTVVLVNGLADDLDTVHWAKFRRAGVHKSVWTWVVTPVIGVLVLAIPIWGDLRPGQPKPYSYLPWLTLALIAAGVIYMLALRAFRPQVIEHAAALLEGDEEVVPATP